MTFKEALGFSERTITGRLVKPTLRTPILRNRGTVTGVGSYRKPTRKSVNRFTEERPWPYIKSRNNVYWLLFHFYDPVF